MNNFRHHPLAVLFFVVFGLLILWPVLAWTGLIPWKIDTFENRRLAEFPARISSLDDLEKWPRRFDKYLDDNLPNRGTLLGMNAWVKYRVFETSPVDSVLVGRDGWLFHRMPSDLLEFEGRLQRPQYQMRRLRVVLEERRDWLAERGIDYMVLVAPTKQTIYPEKMPDWLKPAEPGHSRREMLQAELQRVGSDLELFDFAPVLRESKARYGDALFYRYDSHWTYLGALEAYTALAKQHPKWFRAPGDDWVGGQKSREGNLMHLMGLQAEEVTPYPQPAGGFAARTLSPDTKVLKQMARRGVVSVYQHPDKKRPRLYLMGDSFAGWDTSYLAENFSRTVLTNTWGDQWKRHEQFPAWNIQSERPNLVIDQMLENRLDLGIPRALLGDPTAQNHLPEVRSARLRRLAHFAGETTAEYRRIGDELEIKKPSATKGRAHIVRLELEVGEKIGIEGLSPYAGRAAWDDLCHRGGELTKRMIAPGRAEVLLCVPSKPEAGLLRLRLSPGAKPRILAVRVARHPDV